ncbi:hypothetical protein [Saccharibacillus alkalitolerans]|uniref:Bacitracin ABC transporter ATP-binding protein n=1 Tax=Saccharibacillus alkalitolerans TaxID=2705290 RepID=A0ABX0EZW8_9BACL|nr:hypothetical protein [Saccharibacillus alkalitolerans]NGZ74191.1 hypothetical protein [Saccharibacillus alkalitolerans]
MQTQSNQTLPQFSDVLEEVNFILYGSKSGKPEEQGEADRQEQTEASVR